MFGKFCNPLPVRLVFFGEPILHFLDPVYSNIPSQSPVIYPRMPKLDLIAPPNRFQTHFVVKEEHVHNDKPRNMVLRTNK